LFHYTNDSGFKAIGSQTVWVFKASKPPGRPFGAYFTTLEPGTDNLAKRLRIPKAKTDFVFCFANGDDLKPLDGGRGQFVYYSPDDYAVDKSRQSDSGPTSEVKERLS
jgi:hypothetical protein